MEAFKRKNRRKLELLQHIGSGLIDKNGMYGEVIDEDFVQDLNDITSRPSSASSISRPITNECRPGLGDARHTGGLLGTSRLFAMQRAMTPTNQPLSARGIAKFGNEETDVYGRKSDGLDRRPLSALALSGAESLAKFHRSSTASLLASARDTPEVYGKSVKYPSRESLFGLPIEPNDDVDYSEFGF